MMVPPIATTLAPDRLINQPETRESYWNITAHTSYLSSAPLLGRSNFDLSTIDCCNMKTLTETGLRELAGDYYAPQGMYQLVKSLPFLGKLQCNANTLTAGQYTELVVEYTVGGSGLADGAWIKGTFKFYSVCPSP